MTTLTEKTLAPLSKRTMDRKNKQLKVWIVEDNEVYRNGIEQVIDATSDLLLTAQFEYCESLLKKYMFFSEAELPHVILLDIIFMSRGRHSKMSGIEAIPQIRAALPDVPIVMLTDHNEPDFIFRALQSGASGYLHKSSSSADVQDAIRMAHRGGMTFPPAIASKVLANFREAAASEENLLSERELEIIELMAKGRSRKTIAELLFISHNTVDSHLNKIYNKLHVTTGTEAVAKIYGARSPLRPDGGQS